MGRRSLVATCVLAVVAASCTGGDERSSLQPSIRTVDCPSEIAAVVLTQQTCGFLTVPEDRSDPASRTIDVF